MIKVLLLEDNPLEAGLVKRSLDIFNHDFEVVIVETEKAYEEQLQQFKPDVILSDYILPGYSGMDALAFRNKVCPEIPFIVVSGTIGEERAVRLLKSGATDFFLKDSLQRLPYTIVKEIEIVESEQEKAKISEQQQDFLSTLPGIAFKYSWHKNGETYYEVLRNNLKHWYDEDFFKLDGKSDLLKKYVHPEDWKDLKIAFEKSKENGNILQQEFRVLLPNGQERWILFSAKPKTQDHRTSWTGVLLDRTNKKVLEQKLEKEKNDQREKLKKMVEQRTVELSQLNEDLEAFNASVSHDLKNPLNNLNIFTNLLENKYRNQLDDDGRKYIDFIKKSSEDMQAIIEDLLAFSQVSRTKVQSEKIDMAELIHEVYEGLTLSHENGRAELKLGNCQPVYGDRTMLKHLFLNLLSNAMKYSKNKEQSKIEIGSKKRDDCVEYVVKDNGIGFDMKEKDRLFKPFSRLENSADFEGTGTGLAIVERIVRRHNGEVWAKSEPGKGAAFYFRMPAAKQKQQKRIA